MGANNSLQFTRSDDSQMHYKVKVIEIKIANSFYIKKI